MVNNIVEENPKSMSLSGSSISGFLSFHIHPVHARIHAVLQITHTP